MGTRRIVSVFLAILAAAGVIMAAKSCAKSAVEANKETHKSVSATSSSERPHLITENYDVLTEENSDGRPHLIEETTERQYETVTNMFGEVKETIPITSPEEANMPTSTLSILEEYNQKHQQEQVETTSRYIEPVTDIVLEIG